MEKNMKRSIRRSHITRLRNTRKHYWGDSNSNKGCKRMGIVVNTPCVCSCYMCCNPRKHNEITQQEIKDNISTQEQINELE